MNRIMKELIYSYLNLIFKTGVIIVILSTFFLFTPLISEFFDTPKFLVVLIFVGLTSVLLSLKYALLNKIVFTKTPLDLPLVLLLAVAIVSTILSPSPYVSLVGNQLRIHGSLVALTLYILFYFTLTQNLKSQTDVKRILTIGIWAGALLSILSLLSYFGIKIFPPPLGQGQNFTPTGSNFSTTAVLAVLLPFLVSQIISVKNFTFKLLHTFILILFGTTIALTGTLASWVAGAFGLTLTLLILNPTSSINLKNLVSQVSLIIIAASIIIVGTITALSLIPPVGGTQNPLYNYFRSFPREIEIPFETSWKISVSAFRDSPFWGTGPSTYLFNFTTYKPIEFNSTKFWNLRFDSAYNEYLQILASFGGVGILAFLSITALVVSAAFATFSSKDPLRVGLGVCSLSFLLILLFHASTLPVWIIGILVLACFWIVNLDESPREFSWGKGNLKQILQNVTNIYHSSRHNIRIEALPSIMLIVSVVGVLFVFYFGGKFVIADWHHKNALNAITQNNGVLAYNELIAAEKLNPYNDLYRTDIAQVNFALANAIALSKGPTEASPSGSLTDQDKQSIQVLLQQSISEGRTAVGLSPRSSLNWEILALLYRQIAGVAQNALLFSLDAYGNAILNDPLNPILRLNVGGVYYAVQNYDLAIRFFTDSINLKSDFANAFYNLSVALRDKGDLNAAVAAAERTLALVDANSQDHKVASDYLNDLKSKVQGPPAEPPAATASGALQQKELPKVVPLPKPEKIATPEAIPSPTPAP